MTTDIRLPDYIFNMGDKVKDVVTGYTGIVVTRIDYMTGCNHYGVESVVEKPGDEPKYQNCDEQRLELVEAGAVNLVRKYEKEEKPPAKRTSPGRAVPRTTSR